MGGFGSTSTDVPRQSNAWSWQGASDGLNNMQNAFSNYMSNIGKSTSPSVNSTPNSVQSPQQAAGAFNWPTQKETYTPEQMGIADTVNAGGYTDMSGQIAQYENTGYLPNIGGSTAKTGNTAISNVSGTTAPSIGANNMFPQNAFNTEVADSYNPFTTGSNAAVDSDLNSMFGGVDGMSSDASGGGMWDFLSSGDGLNGFMDNAGSAIDIGTSLYGAWNGMKTADLAQDAFDFTKASTNRNIANTAQSLNTSLEDRQNARVASNPNAYTGTSAYMAKNKLDGSAIG